MDPDEAEIPPVHLSSDGDPVADGAFLQAERPSTTRRIVLGALSVCALVGAIFGITRLIDDDQAVTVGMAIEVGADHGGSELGDLGAFGFSEYLESALWDGRLWTVRTEFPQDLVDGTALPDPFEVQRETVLVATTDGVAWDAVPLPLSGHHIALAASESHLAAVVVNDDGVHALTTADGVSWDAETLTSDAYAWPIAMSSTTHLFVSVEEPSPADRAWMDLDVRMFAAVGERFPDHDSFDFVYSEAGTIEGYEVVDDGGVIHTGSIDELGLSQELLDLAGRDVALERWNTRLWVSDGGSWSDLDPPTSLDRRGLTVSRFTQVGVIMSDDSGETWMNSDGSWRPLELPVDSPWYVDAIVQSDFGYVLASSRNLWRAAELDGPWEKVDLPADSTEISSQIKLAAAPGALAMLVIDFGDDPAFGFPDELTPPDVSVEKDGFTLTIRFSTMFAEDAATAVLETPDGRVIEYDATDVAGEGQLVRVDPESDGSAVFLDPETGEDLVAFTEADMRPVLDEVFAGLSGVDFEDASIETDVVEIGSDPFDSFLENAVFRVLVSSDGVSFRELDLEIEGGSPFTSLVPLPDGTFQLVNALEPIRIDPNS